MRALSLPSVTMARERAGATTRRCEPMSSFGGDTGFMHEQYRQSESTHLPQSGLAWEAPQGLPGPSPA